MTDERTALAGEPGFNCVVPTLDRASTVSTDDQEPHEEAGGEDPSSYGDKYSSRPGGSPGLTDRLAGAPMAMLCVCQGSSHGSSFAAAMAAVSPR